MFEVYTVQYCMYLGVIMRGEDAAIGRPADPVRQIAVPPDARALSTLPRIDYADAFLVRADSARRCSAEQWCRAMLSEAPAAIRMRLLLAWPAIGLMPAVGASQRSILGWQIRSITTEFVLLGRASLIGMPGELLFQRTDGAWLFCTFVQYDNIVGRTVWSSVEATHVQTVRDLLRHAAGRLP